METLTTRIYWALRPKYTALTLREIQRKTTGSIDVVRGTLKVMIDDNRIILRGNLYSTHPYSL